MAFAVNQISLLKHDPDSSSPTLAVRMDFTFLDVVKLRQCSVKTSLWPFGDTVLVTVEDRVLVFLW